MPRIAINRLSPEEFLRLFVSVGWEAPGIRQIERALQNSLATFAAYEDGRAVGMARLIGDGGMSFYIKDFAVRPEYQSHGIGGLLMDKIEGYVRDTIEQDWAVSLELISTKEATGFYEKHGFEACPCEWGGPGMPRMIKSSWKTRLSSSLHLLSFQRFTDSCSGSLLLIRSCFFAARTTP